jgi:hypothetical protein
MRRFRNELLRRSGNRICEPFSRRRQKPDNWSHDQLRQRCEVHGRRVTKPRQQQQLADVSVRNYGQGSKCVC